MARSRPPCPTETGQALAKYYRRSGACGGRPPGGGNPPLPALARKRPRPVGRGAAMLQSSVSPAKSCCRGFPRRQKLISTWSRPGWQEASLYYFYDNLLVGNDASGNAGSHPAAHFLRDIKAPSSSRAAANWGLPPAFRPLRNPPTPRSAAALRSYPDRRLAAPS